ncbi:MAG: cupin domain-containing protein [Pseudomonadota bacterium]
MTPLGVNADPYAAAQLEELHRDALEGVEGREVIMLRVTLPPNVDLPRHWHPGEEFGYVLEGEVTLSLEGQPDAVQRAGDSVKIPAGAIHTAITGDEGATLLVFRTHPVGEPEQVLVEPDQ